MEKKIRIESIIYSLLFYLGVCAFPYNKFIENEYLVKTFNIIALSILLIFLLFDNKFKFLFKGKNMNLLYIPLICGTFSNMFLLFFSGFTLKSVDFLLLFENIIISLLISTIEEIIFRYLVLGYLIDKFNSKKNGDVISILLSSLIFSLCHLVNAFSVNVITLIGTILYTFVLGIILSIIKINNKLIYPLIGHVLFNIINGYLFETIFLYKGNDNLYYIVNGIIGLVILIYGVIIYFLLRRRSKNVT